jgi:large subunit ribosomal protein L31
LSCVLDKFSNRILVRTVVPYGRIDSAFVEHRRAELPTTVAPSTIARSSARRGRRFPEDAMKANIHPKYEDCQVTCACGNKFVTRSTKKEIHLEICSNCHPFFTGKQKFVDTAGRVDKFRKRFNWGEKKPGEAAATKKKTGK